MARFYSTHIISQESAEKRLDQALAEFLPTHSRARLQRWIKEGYVQVNQEPCKPRHLVHAMDRIEIDAPLIEQVEDQAENIPLELVYEDEDLLVINKPAGLVVHPAAGHAQGTLLNALLHHCPGNVRLPRAGLIHRLDKDTSGLLMIAKSLEAHTFLVDQLQKRLISREYLALVQGRLIAGGTIETLMGRHPTQRKKMAVTPHGKSAITHYRIQQGFQTFTLLQIKLETGRTHQIRVHLSHIHHPIVGDPVYGKRHSLPKGCSENLRDFLSTFQRQALHAFRLSLQHPSTQEWMQWEIPLPTDMAALIKLLSEST